jgi:hypothetical protein
MGYFIEEQEERKIRRLYGGKLPVALDENGDFIKPSDGVHGVCPECGGYVVSKMNRKYDHLGLPLIRNHFAHTPKNPECGIHFRSEGIWHLRQKAVFPIDWCEKTIIRDEPEGKKYKFIDVYTSDIKYTLDFESSVEGREVNQRDEFYTSCNVRSSWIFKTTLKDVREKLEIVSLTHKNLSDFKAKQKSDQFYKFYIDRRDATVLIRGDLPISGHTTLSGMPFLNINETAFLMLAPDRDERFFIDTRNDWIFGFVMSIGDMMGKFRPTFRADAQTGDESAQRMYDYVRASSGALVKAGGALKYVRANEEKPFISVKENYSSSKTETSPSQTDLSSISVIDILNAFINNNGDLSELINCEGNDVDSMRAYRDYLNNLRAKIKDEEIIKEGLDAYRRNNITPEFLNLEDFENINPKDHQILFDSERGLYEHKIKEALEKAESLVSKKIDQRELELQQALEEKLRLEEEKIRKEEERKLREEKRQENIRLFEEKMRAAKEEQLKSQITQSPQLTKPISRNDGSLNNWIGKKVKGSFGRGVVVKIIDGGYLKIEIERSKDEAPDSTPSIKLLTPGLVQIIND